MSETSPLIIAFVGTTPNIGTTSASFAAAYRLAEATGQGVGYFCLHLKSAKIHRYIGIDKPSDSLDRLRPELRSQSLAPDKLLRSMHRIGSMPKLSVLFGNMEREQAEFFTPEEAEHLIACAAEAFPVIVLDVGAYWDNAATVVGMRMADMKVLVTTTVLSHFQEDAQQWIAAVAPTFGITPDHFEAVIIHSPYWNGGYRVKEICKEIGTAKLGEFQTSAGMFSALDKGDYEQWLSSDPAGKKAMLEPAAAIVNRYGLAQTRKRAITAQPWFRKLLEHRGGVGS
ncbi:hypothetical protein [Paenibacillus protaetiae]|uniref:ParA family protein n=1 Tax=Paenibacillus protaetiae TaxID=2509456 RepID=A0A4P6EV36_9BACL|nr:hypothetical protein [Paenibacillus protaetiae]QAY66834.1 hypothetical protein ET464_10955 [Paenibacillus protaetiae]